MQMYRYSHVQSSSTAHLRTDMNIHIALQNTDIIVDRYIPLYLKMHMYRYTRVHCSSTAHLRTDTAYHRGVGGWGRDPKKCTGRGWGMGSSTI